MRETMRDLRAADVDVVTLGQYLRRVSVQATRNADGDPRAGGLGGLGRRGGTPGPGAWGWGGADDAVTH